MRKSIFPLLSLLFGCAAMNATPVQAALLASWVQMAPGGEAEVRAAVDNGTCPPVVIDGSQRIMRERAAPDGNFSIRLCAATLPQDAKSVVIMNTTLPLPKASPERIVVLGDTGCRIKGTTVQACNDPSKWPFPAVAAAAAALKPDLVIHVGDYLYRESPCPAGETSCAGSPWGDNWTSWAADFFTPAAPLLAAAPWVILRGNHEDCSRAGPGWLRLLGPLAVDPKALCVDHIPPYAVPTEHLNLIVMDDANAPEIDAPDSLVPVYRGDFASIAHLASTPSWLLMHRPIWGVVQLSWAMVVGGNRTLAAGLNGNPVPPNVGLMIAGHIHTFEAINYESGAPPQIIAGEGGDLLDAAPADLSGRSVLAMKISNGLSLPGYGFLLLTQADGKWTIDVRSADGTSMRTCELAERRLSCLAQ
jgi:hypothetical protein